MSLQPPARIGDVVHHTPVTTGADFRTTIGPCRAAVVTSMPPIFQREPFDGCPNGHDGEWIADLVVLGPMMLDFRGAVDWAGSPTIAQFPEDAVPRGLWHTADQCKKGA